jgi:Zn-dependent protease with chaperone function
MWGLALVGALISMPRQRHLRRTARLLSILTGAGLACGCAGAVHQLPQVSKNDLSMAQGEVKNTAGVLQRHAVADDEALDTMRSALRRIRPSAEQVCREMHSGVCQWNFRASANRSMNASAGKNGLIVINRGIVEYAENEEEVAMVIAHEIGHQAANHPANNQRNQAVGRVAGAVLLGLLGAVASRGSGDNGAITRAAANAGADVGGAIGGIAYSKEQEREADYLSAVILYRAGLDLDKARGFLVKMAKATGRKETGLLDTHPAGPERIAAWDLAVQEVRAAKGGLPQRK